MRAAEVVLDEADAAARRRVFLVRVERHDERGLTRAAVHVQRDLHGHDALDERDELAREVAEHDARIGRGVDGLEVRERGRQLDRADLHRFGEERLLRADVAEERRGRHAELARDVGERRAFEALLGEKAACGCEKRDAVDGRWPAHL